MSEASTTALEVTVRILVACVCVCGIVTYLMLHTAGMYDLCVGPRRVYLGSGIVKLLTEALIGRSVRGPGRYCSERGPLEESGGTKRGASNSQNVPSAKRVSTYVAPRESSPPTRPAGATDVLRITDGKESAAREIRSPAATRSCFEALDSLYGDAAFCVERAIDDNTYDSHDGGIKVCDIDERTRLIFLFGTSSFNEAREGLDISHMDWAPQENQAPIRVHAGFLRAYASHMIKKRVNECIGTGFAKMGSEARFVIAGHSRGAVFAAFLAAERGMSTAVANPLDKIVCSRTPVRFIMCGCPKVFEPATTERLRATRVFQRHVLVVQHANDVVPQLPLATSRKRNEIAALGPSSGGSSARSAELVTYSAVGRLVPNVVRLFTFAQELSFDRPPALQVYHELKTYASSLRTEAQRIKSRARALTRVSAGRMPSFAPWRDFLWSPNLKSKQD